VELFGHHGRQFDPALVPCLVPGSKKPLLRPVLHPRAPPLKVFRRASISLFRFCVRLSRTENGKQLTFFSARGLAVYNIAPFPDFSNVSSFEKPLASIFQGGLVLSESIVFPVFTTASSPPRASLPGTNLLFSFYLTGGFRLAGPGDLFVPIRVYENGGTSTLDAPPLFFELLWVPFAKHPPLYEPPSDRPAHFKRYPLGFSTNL